MKEKNKEYPYQALSLWIHYVFFVAFLFYLLFAVFDDAFLFLKIFLGFEFGLITLIGIIILAILPLAVFFIKNKKTRYITIHSTSLIIYICFFTLVVLSNTYCHDFTKQKWDNHPEIRLYMIDDLKDHHHIIGMRTNEVIELLGEPDQQSDRVFAYYLRKNIRSSTFLEIYFENDIVISIRDYVEVL